MTAPSIPDVTYCEVLDQGLKFLPERTAYHFMGAGMTFGELDRQAACFAGWLNQSGCAPGDVVSFYLPNLPQALIAMAGAFKAGCILNGVSPLLTPKELSYQLNDCRTKVLLGLDILLDTNLMPIKDELPALTHIVVANIGEYLPPLKRFLGKLLKKLPQADIAHISGKSVTRFSQALKTGQPYQTDQRPAPEDTALLMYTGGTTGPSKGCEISNRTLVAEVRVGRDNFGMEMGTEIACAGFPFFHIAGLSLANTCMANAYTQVLVPDPRDINYVVASMVKFKPTFVATVPTLYLMLMDDERFKNLDLNADGNFSACISGAAPFATEPFQALEKIVGKDKLIEAYGLTETCSTFTANPLYGEKKLGSVGLPLAGNRVRIVSLEDGITEVPVGEEGEVLASGVKVMKGYLNKPEETAKTLREIDGEIWLATGDVGKVDEDGYLYIVDRTKDMILVGGYNVFSKIVEDRLFEQPAIEFCAVIGIPNPDSPGDQMVKAVIQLGPDYVNRDHEELKKEFDTFCREELSAYKVPRVYEFTNEIPLTAVGKVNKKALRI